MWPTCLFYRCFPNTHQSTASQVPAPGHAAPWLLLIAALFQAYGRQAASCCSPYPCRISLILNLVSMRPRNIRLTPYVRMTFPRQVKWMPPSACLLRQSPAFLQQSMSDLTATILGYRCAWTATHGKHPGICVCLVPKARPSSSPAPVLGRCVK